MENGSENNDNKLNLNDPMSMRNTETGSLRKAEDLNGSVPVDAGKTQELPSISDPMSMRNTDTGNLRKMAEDTTTRKTIKLKPIRPRGTQPGSLKPVLPGEGAAKPSSPTVRVSSEEVASAVAEAGKPGEEIQTISISRVKSKKTAKLSPLPSVAKAKAVPSKNTIKLRPSTATSTSKPVEGEEPVSEEKKTATIKITAIPGKKKNASKKTIKLTPSTTPGGESEEEVQAAAAPTVGLTPPEPAAKKDMSDAGTVVLQEPPAVAEETATQALKPEMPPKDIKPDISAAGSINIVPPAPPATVNAEEGEEQKGDKDTKTQAIRTKPPLQAKPGIGAAGSINITPSGPAATPTSSIAAPRVPVDAPTIVAGMESPIASKAPVDAPTIVAGMESPVESAGAKIGGGLSIGSVPPPPAGAGAPGGGLSIGTVPPAPGAEGAAPALGGLQIQSMGEEKEDAGPPLAKGEARGRVAATSATAESSPSMFYFLVALIAMGLLIASVFVQAAQYVNLWEQERVGTKIDVPYLGGLVK